jgi:hypothetical protein
VKEPDFGSLIGDNGSFINLPNARGERARFWVSSSLTDLGGSLLYEEECPETSRSIDSRGCLVIRCFFFGVVLESQNTQRLGDESFGVILELQNAWGIMTIG